MIREELRKEIRKLVEQAEKQNRIMSYSDFSKTKLAEETCFIGRKCSVLYRKANG